LNLRRIADVALLAGIGGLAIGMVLVIAGVIAPGFFMPGTWLLVLAFLAIAVSGAARVLDHGRAEATLPRPGRGGVDT
jgi:hypothetical protein